MRVEVLSGVERRRQWSDDEKVRIIEETLVPGARVGIYAAAALSLERAAAAGWKPERVVVDGIDGGARMA